MNLFCIIILFHYLIFSGDDGLCSVLDFGCKGDNKTNNQPCITQSIFSCREKYGNLEHFILFFPGSENTASPSVYVTGAFNLTSNMTLRIGKNAALRGSNNPEDYPLIPPLPSFGIGRDSSAKDLSKRHGALIEGFNLSNIVIEGVSRETSVIDGNGAPWWDKYRTKQLQYSRPRLIELMWGQNIIVRNLKMIDPPFWNTHFVYSQDIVVHGLNIRSPYDAPNADGLDLDSVANVTVFDCDIMVGDDAIAIKSGLNQPGIDYGWPSRDILIHDIRAKSKCISIGSEMSGGVYNVTVSNVEMGDNREDNNWHGIFIKSRKERGGEVSDVTFQNISTVKDAGKETATPFITLTMGYGSGGAGSSYKPASTLPIFRNITFKDIYVANTKAVGEVNGLPDSNRIFDVKISRITATNFSSGLTCTYAKYVWTDFPYGNCSSHGQSNF